MPAVIIIVEIILMTGRHVVTLMQNSHSTVRNAIIIPPAKPGGEPLVVTCHPIVIIGLGPISGDLDSMCREVWIKHPFISSAPLTGRTRIFDIDSSYPTPFVKSISDIQLGIRPKWELCCVINKEWTIYVHKSCSCNRWC